MRSFESGVHDVDGVPVFHRRRAAAVPDAPRVVLLHGGVSDGRVFDDLAAALPETLEVWTYDRRGHGRTPDTDAPLGFDDMVAEAATLITDRIGAPVHVVGHSDGANTALLLAVRHPALVASVTAFSGNLDPSGYVEGTVTVDDLDAAIGDDWATIAPHDRAYFRTVAAKTIELWLTEPRMTTDDVARISAPVLVAVGARDVIRPEHTRAIAEAIPGARLVVVPDTGHMLVADEAAACAALVEETVARAR
ncbi:alpha-beta hydrolase superfamily lysophospholipase [Curtobacterium sp. PhB130]|uniref:alpha/beta fold hydrolase n=1 Tax=unclassified Curtobacterium TaxID=257496 RepID=UPI000F4B3112|nr:MULTISPECIES: alpha/beta fold hydrolase [unclassified Curtobacterium]ROS75758.1 alpha-beta hydrolase superfamily lysophospholipase [Curtobacterium sp. PhB130]TCK64507.1 alpha-beta hydrolase superfamily lysophospholipase [Curtobacterium sp. PhB136]